LLGVCQYLATETGTKQKEIIMLEVFEILLPVGILMACAYGIGYMSGSEAAKNIYDPKIRQSDLDNLRKM
jgi:hypothetical protein